MDESFSEELKRRDAVVSREISNKNLFRNFIRISPEIYIHLISIWILSLEGREPEEGFSIEFRETNKSISLLINLTDPPQGPNLGVRSRKISGYEAFWKFLDKNYQGLIFESQKLSGSSLKAPK